MFEQATTHEPPVDSKGFVWFVGSESLARFDGNGFRTFMEADGLPAGIASDILEGRDATYRVAAGERLCLFDPRPERPRFRCEAPKLGAIGALLEDERTLWCGTATGRGEQRLLDLPFTLGAAEIIVATNMAVMRSLGPTVVHLRLVAPGPAGERFLAEYTFDHQPGRR